MYTEEANRIALINNDDKRLQTFYGTETYPYEKIVIKVCGNEMLIVKDLILKNYYEM